MAQIIAKFGYLKGKSRGGYAKYIATREGVEKLDESLRDRPVTQSQQEFIQKLLKDFPGPAAPEKPVVISLFCGTMIPKSTRARKKKGA